MFGPSSEAFSLSDVKMDPCEQAVGHRLNLRTKPIVAGARGGAADDGGVREIAGRAAQPDSVSTSTGEAVFFDDAAKRAPAKRRALDSLP